MEELILLFQEYIGKQPEKIIQLSGSGSNRKYFRLSHGETSLIGVEGTSFDENKAFITLCRHFSEQNLPVPEIIFHTSDLMYYLQKDLGNTSLFDFISEGRNTGNFSEKEINLLKKTISLLPDFQFKGADNLDFSVCYPQESFDKRTIFWDLNYFKYYYLKTSGIEFQENLLEDDFEQFAEILLQDKSDTFLYRDFQSRNVMIHDNEPFFIDFQGGRKGPVYYDVSSFLWQAKANFPETLREELLDVYLNALKKHQPEINKDSFKKRLKYFVLFRTLQVLGAYGFRGNIEKKKHFIESIPFALNNLKELLQNDFIEFPYLQKILNELLLPLNPLKGTSWDKENNLQITIYSFSYKKGIPEDESGNGGGYIFDCRAIHNPGKYDEYKPLTGLDQPVKDFLEKDGEIIDFLKNIRTIADKHVERYIERNFTNLMLAFGCTGGQHRSVYSAQHLADYLSKKYPVKIKLIHREQGINKEY